MRTRIYDSSTLRKNVMGFSSISRHMARSPENRFAHITPDDHSATIWIASILSLIYTVLVLGVRLGYTKWRMHALDDLVVTLAHLAGFGMWGLLFTSLRNGLGKSFSILSDVDISQVQESFFLGRILLYVALTLSKCSILILIRAVFTRNVNVSRISIGTLAIVTAWGVIGITAVSLHCPASLVIPKQGQDHCVNSIPWLKGVAIGDVLTEVIIMLLPILGLYGTQIPLKSKAAVVLAFLTRIPNIAFSISYLLAYSEFVENHQPPISIIPTVTWQTILLSYNLMSATTPLLRGFTQGFKTAGMSLFDIPDPTSGGASRSRPDNFELQSISRSKLLPQDLTVSLNKTTLFGSGAKQRSSRSNTVSNDNTQCYHDESASVASHDSRRIMIKKEWEVVDNCS